jgi:GNAT superfamily N-acetyltransferase
MDVKLRPAQPEDEQLLYAFYASTRLEEMRLVDWSNEQKEAFVRMQFDAQRQHYGIAFPEAEHRIILVDGNPAGRILIAYLEEEIRVVDIVLLQPYRGAGIGTDLLQDVLEDARRADKPVRLHSLKYERARQWYERLGFEKISDQGLYDFMEWRPEIAAKPAEESYS